MSMTLEQAKEKLAKYGQEHVLKYYGELNEEEKQGILDQIETTEYIHTTRDPGKSFRVLFRGKVFVAD